MNQSQKMRQAIDTIVIPFLFDLGFSGIYPVFTREEDGAVLSFLSGGDGCSFSAEIKTEKGVRPLPGIHGGKFWYTGLYRSFSLRSFPFAYRPTVEEGIKKKWYESKVLSGGDETVAYAAAALCRQVGDALK